MVITRKNFALADRQFTIQKMQFFGADMRWITCTGRQPHEHADPAPYRVGRQQLAFDLGCNLLPFRLTPAARRRRQKGLAAFFGDALRKMKLERWCRPQHIDGPAHQAVNCRTQRLQLGLAIRAGRDMGPQRDHLCRRQRSERISTGRIAMLTRAHESGGPSRSGNATIRLLLHADPAMNAGSSPEPESRLRRDGAFCMPSKRHLRAAGLVAEGGGAKSFADLMFRRQA